MIDRDKVAGLVSKLLLALGQDTNREGLKDTPYRVADAYIEQITAEDPELHRQFSEEVFDELIMVKDIPFSSYCEHHLMPFWGKAHVAYIPGDKLLGISKLARIVSSSARGFQIQERITASIADDIVNAVCPYGVMVVIEAAHACISFRGAKAHGSSTVTSAVRGIYRDSEASRLEVLYLLKGG